MIYYEDGAEITFEPSECINDENQGNMIHESVDCARFSEYTTKNQEEVPAERESIRENTAK